MKSKLFILTIIMSTMLSTVSFADSSEYSTNANVIEDSEDNVAIEVVTDSEEFDKIFREGTFDSSNIQTDIIARGTSIPTKTLNLAIDDDENNSYSFVNYIYSNYKYKPNGTKFYISFTPSTTTAMKLTVYDASTGKAVTNYNNYNLPLKANTLLKVSGLSSSKQYYIKFASATGARVSGVYTVHGA